MDPKLLRYLACPTCQSKLTALRETTYEDGVIVAGWLTCQLCQLAYPIETELPDFMHPKPLSKSFCQDSTTILTRPLLSHQQRQKLLEEKLREIIWSEVKKGLVKEDWAQRDLEYRLKYANQKDKYIYTFRDYLIYPPQSILDLGCGQGGFLSCLTKHFPQSLLIGIESSFAYAQIAKLRDPATQVILADANQLPIQTQSIDLVVSSYALEHIPTWQKVLKESARVATQAFFIFGPNQLFPYDFAHLNGLPLITYLPKPIGKYWVLIVHKLRGLKTNLSQAQTKLNQMNYINPFTFEKEAGKNNFQAINLFPKFVDMTLKEDYQFLGIMKALKRFRFLTLLGARLGAFFKLQPILCYFLRAKTSITSGQGI